MISTMISNLVAVRFCQIVVIVSDICPIPCSIKKVILSSKTRITQYDIENNSKEVAELYKALQT
jgi:hypothetical protein